MRRFQVPLIALLLSCALAQAQDKLAFVVGKHARPDVVEALQAGLAAGAKAAGWSTAEVVVLRMPLKKGALAGQVAAFLYVDQRKAAPLLKEAAAAKLPAFDFGSVRAKGEALTPFWDHAGELEAAAWWLTGPLAHHHLVVYHGRDKLDKKNAKAFVQHVQGKHPGKRVQKERALPRRAKGFEKVLEKDRIAGVSAYLCLGSPEEARVLAATARTIKPPPVVVVSSRALGFDAQKPREEPAPLLPQGTVVLDVDLPGPEMLAKHEEAHELLALTHAGGPWALMAFDAVLALHAARAAAGGDADVTLAQLRAGKARGTRGGYGPSGQPGKPQALGWMVLMMDAGRLRPFPPLNLENPQDRPKRLVYNLPNGIGTFAQWNTFGFKPLPDTTICRFTWGGPKVRTIEADLTKLKLFTGGRLPVLDHLVREKLMTRLMSVTAEKYLLEKDGKPRPGESLAISMVYDWDPKMKKDARKVWPTFVAGDDPAAGGRAFGSYCFVYSTFIYRTIFKKYALFDEDEEFDLADMVTLTGLGRDKEEEYVLGSREDILYRLIENYAGSMALTAAHEIGHLGGLGHDTDSPYGIMNVDEGGGIHHSKGHFTENNLKGLTKTLGRIPKAN